MLVTAEVKQKVTAKLQQCIQIAQEKYDVTFMFPSVVYRKRGTTAGTADYYKNQIDLNPVLLMDNIDAFLSRTVPHEMAHLITGIVYPHTNYASYGKKRSPHGSEWKSVMRVLGADPSRCHNYDISTVKKERVSYEYICEKCGTSIEMSTRAHNKQQRAAKMGLNHFSHNGCRKAKLIWKPLFTSVLAAERPIKKVVEIKVKAPTDSKLSKKDQAISIFKSMNGASRTDIITRFIITMDMTKAGASTYYSNIKSGKWS